MCIWSQGSRLLSSQSARLRAGIPASTTYGRSSIQYRICFMLGVLLCSFLTAGFLFPGAIQICLFEVSLIFKTILNHAKITVTKKSCAPGCTHHLWLSTTNASRFIYVSGLFVPVDYSWHACPVSFSVSDQDKQSCIIKTHWRQATPIEAPSTIQVHPACMVSL